MRAPGATRNKAAAFDPPMPTPGAGARPAGARRIHRSTVGNLIQIDLENSCDFLSMPLFLLYIKTMIKPYSRNEYRFNFVRTNTQRKPTLRGSGRARLW
jgi:hypothetical protein